MTLSIKTATRYLTPLREGGSLPAILEMGDGSLYVVKFRGAGQGARALVAELIVGELARHIGLPVPEIALIDLDESFGRTEPDPEIQDILRGSLGLNVGLRYLEGAYTFDPIAFPQVPADLAADVVWLDAFAANIDRTPRNTNILLHADQIWLIDHGAALYFHHNWEGVTEQTARSPFGAIRDHCLLPLASSILAADERMAAAFTPSLFDDLLALVPDQILMDAPAGTVAPFPTAEENRRAYTHILRARMESPRPFVEQAEQARISLEGDGQVRKEYRR